MSSYEGVEVSESSSSVFVQNCRVYIFVVIVDEALGDVENLVFQRVVKTDENRKPLVVRNKLVLGNRNLSSFLEDCFVVPVRIQFC
jgi:hypothetical protein